MLINLSKRMQEIKSLISYRRVADIGSDHGKIVVRAFQENLIDYAIFSDISEKCAKKPIELMQKLGIINYDIRVGDGLETIKASDNILQVIISGLGGEEIINILDKRNLTFESYILQPQKHEEKLKHYLINNGYKIVFDKIIYDCGKFYNILKAEEGLGKLTKKEIMFGLNNKGSSDFKRYLTYLKNKYTKLLSKVTDEKKIKNLKDKLKLIEGEINE